MKTKFDSYINTDMCDGCKLCLKGQKLVLFVGGKCSRACWYCSLSEGRKNSPQLWANERPCNSDQEIIQEATDSNARGAGITGGDPIAYLDRTLSAAKALKSHFKKSFHIHVYLPLPLVNKPTLEKLHENIDEVRFHPSFLTNPDEILMQEEIKKISEASLIFGKQNTGLEMPLLPEKKEELISFIKKAETYISFVNLNEFEISDTNFDKVTKEYSLNEDTYTIYKSLETGKEILKQCKNLPLKIHVCTASTKNHHQYANRLLLHKILPYGTKTDEGTVIYFTIIPDNMEETVEKLKKYTKNFHIDESHKRILLKKSELHRLYKTKKFVINLCEEHPTFDAEKMSFWKLTDEDFN